MIKKIMLITLLSSVLLSGCQDGTGRLVKLTKTGKAVPSSDMPADFEPITAEDNQPVGPALISTPVEENFPQETPQIERQDINPLTGLPVADSANLALPPALVSVANFPPTARPQAGLSFSPIVFELFIGEGMTRYLAIFYGDYPQASQRSFSANREPAKRKQFIRLPE